MERKTSVVGCNFIKLAGSAYNFTKTVLKMVFPKKFSEFSKKLLYFQISSSTAEVHLEPNQKSTMQLFGKKS